MPTYQDFPPDLRRLSPRLTVTGAVASLVSINTTLLPDGARVFVSDVGTDYLFRRESTDAPSGDVVVAPSAGPGRWLQMAGAEGDVALVLRDNLTELAAINTTDAALWPDGITGYVRSVEDFYVLDRNSALTADGITIVAPTTGPGRWLRRNTASPTWARQGSWFVNAGTGDDENTGATTGTALRTHAELERRLNGSTLQQDTTITIEADLDATADASPSLDVQINGAFVLRYVGVPTVVDTGTLTGQTVTDPATNVQQLVADSGQDFSPHVGRRIEFATAGNAVAWIAAVTTPNTEVRISEPMEYAGAPPQDQGQVVSLAGLPTYEVQTLPNVRGLSVRTRRPVSDLATVDAFGLVFENLSFNLDPSMIGNGGFSASGDAALATLYAGCEVIAATMQNAAAGVLLTACRCVAGAATLLLYGQWVMSGAMLTEARIEPMASLLVQTANLLVQTGGLEVKAGALLSASAAIGIFDFATGLFCADPGAQVDMRNKLLYGTSAVVGALAVVLRAATRLAYEDASAQPVITVTGGGGAAELELPAARRTTWAAAALNAFIGYGLVENSSRGMVQSGTGTLSAGVVTVTGVFVSVLSRIVVTRSAAAGASIGLLAVTARVIGEPGTAQFTVTSQTTAGATDTNDGSTFDWIIVDAG